MFHEAPGLFSSTNLLASSLTLSLIASLVCRFRLTDDSNKKLSFSKLTLIKKLKLESKSLKVRVVVDLFNRVFNVLLIVKKAL